MVESRLLNVEFGAESIDELAILELFIFGLYLALLTKYETVLGLGIRMLIETLYNKIINKKSTHTCLQIE